MSHGISHTVSYLRACVFRSRHGMAHTIANSQQVSAILLKNHIRDNFRRPEIQHFPGGGMGMPPDHPTRHT